MDEVLTPDQLQAYLDRIGFYRRWRGGESESAASPPLPPATLEALATLSWAHATTLPFENLSLAPGLQSCKVHDATADLAAAYAKLVRGGRGGYCFESNLLFAAALRALGFDLYPGAARVVMQPRLWGDAPPPPGRHKMTALSHRVAFVRLAGEGAGGGAGESRLWLADVAFGAASPPLPVRLPARAFSYAAPAADEPHAGAPYAGAPWAAALPVARAARVRVRPGLLEADAAAAPADLAAAPQRAGYYLQGASTRGGEFKDLYFFTMAEALPQDFAAFNAAVAAPDGPWRRMTWASLPSDAGRVTLLDDDLRAYDADGGLVAERRVETEAAKLAALREHFGLDL